MLRASSLISTSCPGLMSLSWVSLKLAVTQYSLSTIAIDFGDCAINPGTDLVNVTSNGGVVRLLMSGCVTPILIAKNTSRNCPGTRDRKNQRLPILLVGRGFRSRRCRFLQVMLDLRHFHLRLRSPDDSICNKSDDLVTTAIAESY